VWDGLRWPMFLVVVVVIMKPVIVVIMLSVGRPNRACIVTRPPFEGLLENTGMGPAIV